MCHGYIILKGGKEGEREKYERGWEGFRMKLLRGRNWCQWFFCLEEGGEGELVGRRGRGAKMRKKVERIT